MLKKKYFTQVEVLFKDKCRSCQFRLVCIFMEMTNSNKENSTSVEQTANILCSDREYHEQRFMCS